MDASLNKFIWRYSRPQQIALVLMTFASFPILYLTLELPKWIINDALSGSSQPRSFLGQELDPVPFLVALCLSLLALIIFNGALKMRINTFKGIVGERLVRRLRYNLIHNMLRFPLPYFSKISSGEVISTVTAETEPLGGYIGESVALPLFQGGTMITILIFMFAQDWVFGLVSVALIPVQGYVIPKLQHQVNLLKKDRVRRVRKLSERIGETVAGATEIRLHGTQPYTLAEFSRRLGELFHVRLEIFKKKFFMKFLNNTIGQLTPFMFYLFGGYLVIKGDITIGALVAAIGAYKDLTAPWKELLNFYQLHEDSKIKYQQILELFNPERLDPVDENETTDQTLSLKGDIDLVNISWRNENGEPVLSGVNLHIDEGTMVAITGDFPIRRTRLAQLLSGLEPPSGGRLSIGGEDLDDIPDAVLRRKLILQRPDPHMFAGTIVDNMEYGLNQLEPQIPEEGPLHDDVVESLAAGNRPPLDTGWRDFRQAGLPSNERSTEWFQAVINAVGSDRIIYERSLSEVFSPEEKPELAEKLLRARRILRQRIQQCGCSDDIHQLDPDVFNPSISLGDNLLFGRATDDRLAPESLDINPWYITTLSQQKLLDTALTMGREAAVSLLTMFDDGTLSPELAESFGLTDEDRVDRIRGTLDGYVDDEHLSEDCRCLLISVFLQIVPSKHHFVRINARLSTQLLQARREFRAGLPDSLQDGVCHFDPDAYHPSLTVLDNLLFGRMNAEDPHTRRMVSEQVELVINELSLRGDLNQLLGESQVGISGSRLPQVAKHNISLTRNLIKRPDVLIFHDALGAYGIITRHEILDRIRALLPQATIIWIASDVPNEAAFDEVFHFTEQGPLLSSRGPTRESGQQMEFTVSNENLDDVELIAHSPIFAMLTPDQHRFLADNSSRVRMRAETRIYAMNDHADAAWMMIKGKVHTLRGEEIVGRFQHPETFGALEVLADCPRIMGAMVAEDSLMLKIDGAALEQIILSDAHVSRNLLKALSFQWRGQIQRNLDGVDHGSTQTPE